MSVSSDTSAKSPKESPDPATRAGSHAGRGFRFQDAVSAWLAVRCWSGEATYGAVVPEGGDDAELLGVEGSTFVQIKSRREHLGPYAPGDVAAFVRALWTRAAAAKAKPAEVLLIIERPIDGLDLAAEVATALSREDRVGRLVASHAQARQWLGKTKLMVCAEPSRLGATTIAKSFATLPIVAETCFATLTARIGTLSEDNGLLGEGTFKSLAVADITRIIDDLVGVLAKADLEEAVAKGLCEAVDFTTPMVAADFYLGADVQPGHLAAGLLVERPASRERVLEALEGRRAALITGPSGSGKSGLMWQAARATRHTIRWFRIRQAAPADVATLLRLTVTYKASAFSPIGFVIDDVGRSRTELWDALAAEAATRPGVLLLGSLRQEDMFLVKRRALTADLCEAPDEDLAARLWEVLREQSQTTQPFWKEPWAQANGLLLEYVHILTQGRRLADVLGEQVTRRVDEKRYDELEILRVASVAGQTGAIVEPDRLAQTLGQAPVALSEALRRLVDEHLVQARADGRIGSLHQIRARTISALTHAVPPPTLAQSIKQALMCVSADDIEGFIARSLALDIDVAEALVEAALKRWRADGGLGLLAAILRGFATGDIERTIRLWLASISDLALPPTQITQALTFAVAKTEPFLLEKLARHFEAANRFNAMAHQDHRVAVLTQVDGEVGALLAAEPAWPEVTTLLEANLGASLPPKIMIALQSASPALDDMTFEEINALLEAAHTVNPALVKAWMGPAGQDALLKRLTAHAPWRSTIALSAEPEGLAVAGTVFHVSDALQPDIHADVVELCQLALSVAPEAELAVFAALDPNGLETGIGFPIASKRIPRANLPVRAEPLRNRQWIRAAAESLAPYTPSQYLAKATALLDELLPALEGTVDAIARGNLDTSYLDALGQVYEAALALTYPIRPDGKGGEAGVIGVSDLQNILHQCATDAPRWLLNLPDSGAAGYMALQGLIEQIDRVKVTEPWDLIVGGAPASLDRLRALLVQLGQALGASRARGAKIHEFAPDTVRKAGPGKAIQRLSAFLAQLERQARGDLERLLRDGLRARGFAVTAHAQPTTTISEVWPYSEMVVVIDLSPTDDWIQKLAELALATREMLPQSVVFQVMPAVRGLAIPAWTQRILDERLLPVPFQDTTWLANVGRPALSLTLADTLDSIQEALLTLSAITAFGCATPGRHHGEAQAQAHYQTLLAERRATLTQALDAEAAAEVETLLQALSNLGGELSIAFYDVLAGVPSANLPLLERAGALKAKLTAIDLSRATPPKR